MIVFAHLKKSQTLQATLNVFAGETASVSCSHRSEKDISQSNI